MKKNIFVILFILIQLTLTAQCFNIESILADACGNPEGANEMVTLNTLSAIDIDNLDFDWPNNSFLGWCADAPLTIALNQSITSSCGLLLEPPFGIVPAGKKLLIVSSTDMLVAANSFEGLTDTLYIIYQCAGNTSGHFSNGATSSRTLTVSYAGTCNETESASYVGADLVGGDGGVAFYDTSGNVSYYNSGCNAPVPSIYPNWSFIPKICNTYGLIDLDDFISPFSSGTGVWSGDIESGHFFNSIGKLGTYSITYTVNDVNGCLPSTDSTIAFQVEDVKRGNDTVIVCDSINQFGIWIYQDTIADILIEYNNEYLCDSIISKYYFINTTDFVISPTEVNLESDESHTFNIEGTNNFTYSYNNGLGDSCALPCFESTLMPEESSLYSISVIDETNGCIKELDLQINVIYNSILNIPNTFTPNGDGENDVFKIYGEDLERIQYNIYSKWGEMLFEGTSLDDFWDGIFKNKAMASGVYILHLDILGKDDTEYKRTERLRLVR